MAARMRSFDWSKTPLGPVENWPQTLRTAIRIMLSSRFAMWMAWGPDLTFFCNDAYAPTLGLKRTWALGSPAASVWAEIWPDIGPRIEPVLKAERPRGMKDCCFFLSEWLHRRDLPHFSYSPLADDTGRVNGMLCVVTEETERVIGERHLKTLRDLGTRTTAAKTVEEACRLIVTTLGENTADVPFSLLYVVAPDGKTAWLCEASQLQRGTSVSPEIIELTGRNLACPGRLQSPWPETACARHRHWISCRGSSRRTQKHISE